MKADVRFCHLGIGQEILLWGIDCSTTKPTEIAVSQEYTTNTAIFYLDNDEKPLDFDIIWGYHWVS
jgi:hypothetical protein